MTSHGEKHGECYLCIKTVYGADHTGITGKSKEKPRAKRMETEDQRIPHRQCHYDAGRIGSVRVCARFVVKSVGVVSSNVSMVDI